MNFIVVGPDIDITFILRSQRHDDREPKQSANGENTFQSSLHGAIFITPTGDHSTEHNTQRFPPQFQRVRE